MIISTDARRALDKIQHTFVIKILNKIGIEGVHVNTIKVIYENPTVNIIISGEN